MSNDLNFTEIRNTIILYTIDYNMNDNYDNELFRYIVTFMSKLITIFL